MKKLTLAKKAEYEHKVLGMEGNFFRYRNKVVKIQKVFFRNGFVCLTIEKANYEFSLADFDKWSTKFTPTSIPPQKEIVYDPKLINPLNDDDEENDTGNFESDDLGDVDFEGATGFPGEDDPENDPEDPENEDEDPENEESTDDEITGEAPESEVPVKTENTAVVRKSVDDEIEDILPIFDVYSFDNLSAELTRMMTEVITTKRITPELLQKASTVNTLAASIAKIQTDKISSAVLLAQNAKAIKKLLNPKPKK
jgi:hypothetical protein